MNDRESSAQSDLAPEAGTDVPVGMPLGRLISAVMSRIHQANKHMPNSSGILVMLNAMLFVFYGRSDCLHYLAATASLLRR